MMDSSLFYSYQERFFNHEDITDFNECKGSSLFRWNRVCVCGNGGEGGGLAPSL